MALFSNKLTANFIALDQALFSTVKSIDNFLISPQKHMLWGLIRSTLLWWF